MKVLELVPNSFLSDAAYLNPLSPWFIKQTEFGSKRASRHSMITDVSSSLRTTNKTDNRAEWNFVSLP